MTMTTDLPKGPQIPSILQLINWIIRPFEYLQECAKKYGDIFTINFFGLPPWIVISDPKVIQEVFSTDTKDFNAGQSNTIIRPLVGDQSIFLSDNLEHRRKRKLLMPSFHDAKVKTYAETICKITSNTIEKLEINKPFKAREIMQNITLEVILQTVFGLKEGERYEKIKPLLFALVDLTGSPLRSSLLFFPFLQQDLGAWSPWGKFVRGRQEICQILQSEIEEKRANSEIQGDDILSLMLSSKDEVGNLMTDQELRDEMLTLLLAGYESTATSLAWALYWIERFPKIKEKLLEEVNDLGVNPDPLEVFRAPYLSAVCNETLRIYPIIPIVTPRVAKSRVTIGNRDFESGTIFAPCVYLTHHKEDLYPNSFQFKPERFLERQYNSYEFFPFGGGNRRCLGYALAMLEMKLVITTILSKYDLQLQNVRQVKPERRGITLVPSTGIPLILTGFRDFNKESDSKICVANN